MKKFITILFIIATTSINLNGAGTSTIEEKGLWKKFLVKMKIREDTAKHFQYSKIEVFSKKGGSRRVKTKIKNNSPEDFNWATFKLILGEDQEVHRFTINNFKKNKTYFFNSDVEFGSLKSKNLKVVYVNSEKM